MFCVDVGNVDAPEMQVEDASAGAGKETHLTDVIVMLYKSCKPLVLTHF